MASVYSYTSNDEVSSDKKLTSVWNYFDKVEITSENDTKEPKAKCKLCDKLLASGPHAGTSHLRRHHELHCRIKNSNNVGGIDNVGLDENETQDLNHVQLEKNATEIMKTFSYNEFYCREAMIEYIIRAEQPLNMMETRDFTKTIQQTINPQFKGWSQDVVERYIMEKYNTQKEILKNFLANFDGKICLTCDTWASLTEADFLCVTAHYVDTTWKLNKRVISFKMTLSNGKSIANLINDEITNLGIRDKIYTITSNNNPNNDLAMHTLKKSWQLNEVHAKLFHVSCCARNLDLTVKDVLEQVESTLRKIRGFAHGINLAQSKYEVFLDCCKMSNVKRKNINLDLDTSWKSTYKLLKNVIKYKKVVQLYESQLSNNKNDDDDDDIDVLNDYDWHIASLLRDLFKVFYRAMDVFCGVYHPTSNQVIMHVTNVYIVLQKYLSLSMFNDKIFEMVEMFKKCWGEIPLIYYIALIIDPRLKFEALDEWLKIIYFNNQIKIEEIKNEIDSLLYNLYIYYKEKYDNDTSSRQSLKLLKNPPYFYEALEILRNKKRRTRSSSSCASELDRYLSDDAISLENYEDFDILTWWRSEHYTYPVLSILARDVLTIPVSTVASEAAFCGVSGRRVSENRDGLRPSVIEADLCLRDWRIGDQRMHDSIREARMLEALKSLKLSKHEWMLDDSSSSPESND